MKHDVIIPKAAMKYTNRPYVSLDQFHRDSDKFAKIMYKHYPHLSRHEIDEINLNITKNNLKINWNLEHQQKKRQEMLNMHRRYLDYKMRGDYENLAVLEEHYININKKCYDQIVEEIKEMGFSTRYAPDKIADLKYFVKSHDESTSNIWIPLIIAILSGIGFIYMCLP